MSGTKVQRTHNAYRRPEDPTNFITYALAACVTFVGLVFLLLKTVDSAVGIAAVAVSGGVTLGVFIAGAVYSVLPLGRAKDNVQRLIRREKLLLCYAAFTPLFLIGLNRGGETDKVFGYVLFAVASAVVIADIAVNVFDVAEHKTIDLAAFVSVAWVCVLCLWRVFDLVDFDMYWMMSGGLVLYLFGSLAVWILDFSARYIVGRILTVGGATLMFLAVFYFLV